MDNNKFKQLHDLVINENSDAARELFHDIVIEKSREIFESLMRDEMDEGMGGQVGDLLDEINAEEQGMTEEEEEADDDMDFADDTIEFDGDDDDFDGEEAEHEEIEDAVIRIEDKLDQLMAEFEDIMGSDTGEEDFDGEDGDFGADDEFSSEDGADDEFGDEEDEEAMMENVQLQKVSVTHGDNGAYSRSPSLHDPKVKAAGVNPVRFSGSSEAVPNGPKGPSNAYSKGEGNLPGAGNFKNAPGKGNFKEKGEAAPKPKQGDDGANSKSPIAESRRRPARRPIR